MRWEGIARGPPGIEGVVVMLMARGLSVTVIIGLDIGGNLAEVGLAAVVRTLALRVILLKNPGPLPAPTGNNKWVLFCFEVMEVEGIVCDRAPLALLWIANAGYGKAGGVITTSSDGRVARSVAV